MSEPVAWIAGKQLCKLQAQAEMHSGFNGEPVIPLYTHPADESFDRTASHMAGEYVSYPAKTLTISDRDILKIVHDKFTKFGFEADYIVEDTELIDFARAILRKAQE